MSRPASPLLHDYKPSAAKKPAKSKALQWFAVGLGIPLIGVALVSVLTSSELPPPAIEEPVMTATDAEPPAVEELDADAITRAVLEPEPPPPAYDRLTLEVGRGDTMEKLFRKHSLDLGHLAQIARLDEARSRFRSLKPGDVFEVQHDEGRLVSMYSALDLSLIHI